MAILGYVYVNVSVEDLDSIVTLAQVDMGHTTMVTNVLVSHYHVRQIGSGQPKLPSLFI